MGKIIKKIDCLFIRPDTVCRCATCGKIKWKMWSIPKHWSFMIPNYFRKIWEKMLSAMNAKNLVK